MALSSKKYSRAATMELSYHPEGRPSYIFSMLRCFLLWAHLEMFGQQRGRVNSDLLLGQTVGTKKLVCLFFYQ